MAEKDKENESLNKLKDQINKAKKLDETPALGDTPQMKKPVNFLDQFAPILNLYLLLPDLEQLLDENNELRETNACINAKTTRYIRIDLFNFAYEGSMGAEISRNNVKSFNIESGAGSSRKGKVEITDVDELLYEALLLQTAGVASMQAVDVFLEVEYGWTPPYIKQALQETTAGINMGGYRYLDRIKERMGPESDNKFSIANYPTYTNNMRCRIENIDYSMENGVIDLSMDIINTTLNNDELKPYKPFFYLGQYPAKALALYKLMTIINRIFKKTDSDKVLQNIMYIFWKHMGINDSEVLAYSLGKIAKLGQNEDGTNDFFEELDNINSIEEFKKWVKKTVKNNSPMGTGRSRTEIEEPFIEEFEDHTLSDFVKENDESIVKNFAQDNAFLTLSAGVKNRNPWAWEIIEALGPIVNTMKIFPGDLYTYCYGILSQALKDGNLEDVTLVEVDFVKNSNILGPNKIDENNDDAKKYKNSLQKIPIDEINISPETDWGELLSLIGNKMKVKIDTQKYDLDKYYENIDKDKWGDLSKIPVSLSINAFEGEGKQLASAKKILNILLEDKKDELMMERTLNNEETNNDNNSSNSSNEMNRSNPMQSIQSMQNVSINAYQRQKDNIDKIDTNSENRYIVIVKSYLSTDSILNPDSNFSNISQAYTYVPGAPRDSHFNNFGNYSWNLHGKAKNVNIPDVLDLQIQTDRQGYQNAITQSKDLSYSASMGTEQMNLMSIGCERNIADRILDEAGQQKMTFLGKEISEKGNAKTDREKEALEKAKKINSGKEKSSVLLNIAGKNNKFTVGNQTENFLRQKQQVIEFKKQLLTQSITQEGTIKVIGDPSFSTLGASFNVFYIYINVQKRDGTYSPLTGIYMVTKVSDEISAGNYTTTLTIKKTPNLNELSGLQNLIYGNKTSVVTTCDVNDEKEKKKKEGEK